MLYFIVNYSGGSGKARKTWNRVHSLLKEKGVDYKAYVTKYAGHAKILAAKIEAIRDDDKKLVVVGGDGTINEVLNGLQSFDSITFGVIPTGSGNDFSRGLDISRNPEESLEKVLACDKIKNIDIGEVVTGSGTKRYFGISSGIGLDAIVCKKNLDSKIKRVLNKVRLGSLSYIILTLTNLFSMETYKVKVKMENDGEREEVEFNRLIFLAAMNFYAEGGGVPMNPNAKGDDGKLSICAVSGIPKWRTFFYLPVLTAGKHEHKKGFMLRDVQNLSFDADRPMVLHADGEYLGDETHIEMKVLKNILKVIV